MDRKPKNDEYYAKMYSEWHKKNSNETPPYSDDLITNSDFGLRSYHDDVSASMSEEVASATAANGSGMGAVVSPQPSNVPGQTIGGNNAGDSFGDGGIVGSGDISAGQIKNKNVFQRPTKSRRKNKMKAKAKEMAKNLKNTFKGNEYKQGGDKTSHLMSFTDFSNKS